MKQLTSPSCILTFSYKRPDRSFPNRDQLAYLDMATYKGSDLHLLLFHSIARHVTKLKDKDMLLGVNNKFTEKAQMLRRVKTEGYSQNEPTTEKSK